MAAAAGRQASTLLLHTHCTLHTPPAHTLHTAYSSTLHSYMLHTPHTTHCKLLALHSAYSTQCILFLPTAQTPFTGYSAKYHLDNYCRSTRQHTHTLATLCLSSALGSSMIGHKTANFPHTSFFLKQHAGQKICWLHSHPSDFQDEL